MPKPSKRHLISNPQSVVGSPEAAACALAGATARSRGPQRTAGASCAAEHAALARSAPPQRPSRMRHRACRSHRNAVAPRGVVGSRNAAAGALACATASSRGPQRNVGVGCAAEHATFARSAPPQRPACAIGRADAIETPLPPPEALWAAPTPQQVR